MRALRLLATGSPPKLEVRDTVVGDVGPGQVLVRLETAAVHRTDLLLCRSGHGLQRPVPTTPGVAGVGRVVKVGPGWMTGWLVGRRVACLATPLVSGTWAPYLVTDARRCLPLPDDLGTHRAALGLYPAVCAVAALQALGVGRRKGLVVTAPDGPIASALVAISAARGVPLIVVARDADEAKRAARPGVAVLDASQPDIEAQLRRQSRATGVQLLVDAAGGPLLGRLLAALPDGSEAVVLNPAAQTLKLDPVDLVLHGKVVRGLSLDALLEASGPRGLGRWSQALLARLQEVGPPGRAALSLQTLLEEATAEPREGAFVPVCVDL